MAGSVGESQIFKGGTQAISIQSKELNDAKNKIIYATDYRRHKFTV